MKLTPALMTDDSWYSQSRRQLEIQVVILHHSMLDGLAPVAPGVLVYDHTGKR